MSDLDTIQIGKVQILPGQRVTVNLPIPRLYTYTDVTMPVHVIRGRHPGPSLFVSAAVHGDEINGVEIIRRLLSMKLLNTLRGTLFAVPVVNVYGFVNRTRYLPDRRDLNRSFPGSPKGSLASQVANQFIEEIVDHCTHGIDLHTGSNFRANLPQIRACLGDVETARLAHAFGAPVILDASLRDGSLREAVRSRGIPILLYEAGESLRIDDAAVHIGLRGVLAVMREIGLLPSQKELRHKLEPLVARSSRWVRAVKSGMMHSSLALGKRVQKEEQIAIIADPGGENAEAVLSSASGIIIGRQNLPLVYRGDAIFHIARFDDSAPVDSVLDAFESETEWSESDATFA